MANVCPSLKPTSPPRVASGAAQSDELLATSLPPRAALQDDPSAAASLLEESETYVMAVVAAIADLAAHGFPAHFDVADDHVVCVACRSRCNSHDVAWLAHTQVSDAASGQTSLVCGLRCPICGTRGTATATVEQYARRRDRRARSHTDH